MPEGSSGLGLSVRTNVVWYLYVVHIVYHRYYICIIYLDILIDYS